MKNLRNKADAWDKLTEAIEKIDDSKEYEKFDDPEQKRNEDIAAVVDKHLFEYDRNFARKRKLDPK